MLRLARRRTRAQGLAEVAVVCSIMTTLASGGAGAAWGVRSKAHETEMRVYMKQMYTAIQMFCGDHDDKLPRADFYPDTRRDANACTKSRRSIVVQLGGYVGDNRIFVASEAPEKFKKAGLTYVWNTAVNGKQLDQLPPKTWLLMDMNAAAYAIPDLVPRSKNGYLVLWSDGSVKFEVNPPQVVKDSDVDTLKASVKPGDTKDPANPGAPGTTPGGTTPGAPGDKPDKKEPVAAPEPVVPKDPDTEIRVKEEQARTSNPDEEDAAHE